MKKEDKNKSIKINWIDLMSINHFFIIRSMIYDTEKILDNLAYHEDKLSGQIQLEEMKKVYDILNKIRDRFVGFSGDTGRKEPFINSLER